MKLLLTILSFLTLQTFVTAQTAVGVWKTIDDKTNEAKSEVTITDVNGKIFGKVTKLLRKTADPNRKCVDCKGAKKGQLILGMNIVEGLWKSGDQWEGGTITDPENGKEYSCKIKFKNGNPDQLEVRGFLGISLLGRSQTWYRVK
jgi:uncharacterized protein (DUF2147 family)